MGSRIGQNMWGVNWPCLIKHKLKWRRTYVHTDVQTRSGEPHEGRPLLGPAKLVLSNLQLKTTPYLDISGTS